MFEVDGSLSGSDQQGRLSFSIEYEMTSKRKEIYGPIENKAVARVQIQQDNTFAIVPVVKVSRAAIFHIPFIFKKMLCTVLSRLFFMHLTSAEFEDRPEPDLLL